MTRLRTTPLVKTGSVTKRPGTITESELRSHVGREDGFSKEELDRLWEALEEERDSDPEEDDD